jgi:hypothetical protein
VNANVSVQAHRVLAHVGQEGEGDKENRGVGVG